MRYFRALAVVCLALGLFVQVAAHAAATPQVRTEVPTAGAMNCSEMAHSGHGEAREEPSDMGGPCDMTLGCLVAMNCIPPMALAVSMPADAPLPSAGTSYQAKAAVRLKGSPIPPESPPPQRALTA